MWTERILWDVRWVDESPQVCLSDDTVFSLKHVHVLQMFIWSWKSAWQSSWEPRRPSSTPTASPPSPVPFQRTPREETSSLCKFTSTAGPGTSSEMIKRILICVCVWCSQRRGGVFLHSERPPGFTQLHQILQTQRYGGSRAPSEGARDWRSEGEEGFDQVTWKEIQYIKH